MANIGKGSGTVGRGGAAESLAWAGAVVGSAPEDKGPLPPVAPMLLWGCCC